MSRACKCMIALAMTLVAPGYIYAYEVFPPGTAYYGPSWHPGAGSLVGGDIFYPGPVGYGPMARAELFPFGPAGYGLYGSAADVFPPGPTYYGPDVRRYEVFSPGPVGYGPLWSAPYYGFPYPPCRPEQRTTQAFRWPTCIALEGQRGSVGGKTLPQRPAQPSQAPAAAFQPPPVRAPEREAVIAPRGRSDAYRYEGEMIYGPDGSAYQRFGTRPPFGTQYERSGNMLYGVGSRCRLFGNTAFCW